MCEEYFFDFSIQECVSSCVSWRCALRERYSGCERTEVIRQHMQSDHLCVDLHDNGELRPGIECYVSLYWLCSRTDSCLYGLITAAYSGQSLLECYDNLQLVAVTMVLLVIWLSLVDLDGAEDTFMTCTDILWPVWVWWIVIETGSLWVLDFKAQETRPSAAEAGASSHLFLLYCICASCILVRVSQGSGVSATHNSPLVWLPRSENNASCQTSKFASVRERRESVLSLNRKGWRVSEEKLVPEKGQKVIDWSLPTGTCWNLLLEDAEDEATRWLVHFLLAWIDWLEMTAQNEKQGSRDH